MANPNDLPVVLTQAGPATGATYDVIRNLVTEFNKMVTNLRVLTAKLDADAGVTDTNYGTLVTDSAASGPAKLAIFGKG